VICWRGDHAAQHSESGSEIFWGPIWGPHFDCGFQTNQISGVEAGDSIPFTRSKSLDLNNLLI
jgi:hypothetical protein